MKKILKILSTILFTFILLISCTEAKSKKVLVEELEKIRTEKLITSETVNTPFVIGFESLVKRFDYEILEVKQEKEISSIKLNLKAVKLEKYMEELMQLLFKESLNGELNENKFSEIALDYFTKLSETSELEYNEIEIIAKLSKRDGKWVLDNKEEIVNFLQEIPF